MELPDVAFDRLLGSGDDAPLVNIGCGEDLTIRELAELVRTVVGYTGDIRWDSGKPDGTPRKALDASRMGALGWKPAMPLKQGIVLAYADYLTRGSRGVEAIGDPLQSRRC